MCLDQENHDRFKLKQPEVYQLFLVFRNQLVDWYGVVLHLSSSIRVVSEGKHQRSNSSSVWNADESGALVKHFSLNVVDKNTILLEGG